MRVLIEQAALQKALVKVAAVVERRNTIPILGNVLISAGDEGIRLTATDLELEAIAAVEGTIERPGKITVGAQVLTDIVRNAQPGAEILVASDSTYRLSVAFGRSNFDLPALPAEDFPVRTDDRWEHSVEIMARDLHTILERSIFAASTDETRYFLHGVYLHMVAHNGRPWLRGAGSSPSRIAYSQVPREKGSPVFPGVRLPRKAVAEFMRALDGRALMTTLHLSETGARLQLPEIVLTTKLLDGIYPEYTRSIAETWAVSAECDRQLLVGAVRRVGLLSSDKGLRLQLTADSLTVSARSLDTGKATETIEIAYAGDDHEMGVNGRDLLDALNQSEVETIRLMSNTNQDPICIQPTEGDPEADHFLCILSRRVVAA